LFSVVSIPFYSPGINFYPQSGKVVPAGGIIEKFMPFGMLKMCDGKQKYQQLQQRVQPDYNCSNSDSKTLTLFPLHPTGILEEKTANEVSSHASVSVDVTDACHGSLSVDKDSLPENQKFLDFLTLELGSPKRA